jgi:hypothetical protein
MLTIDLRGADGRELPYQLQIAAGGFDDYLEFRMVARDTREVLSTETFHSDLVPLSRYHPDLEGVSIVMGCLPDEQVMLFEFGGKDARLAMAGLGEVRSAVNVAKWHDRDMVAA